MEKIPYIMISNRIFYLVLSFILIYYISPYLTPFFIALIIAVILEPFIGFLSKNFNIHRTYAVIIVFSIFLILVLGLIGLGFTKIVFEIISLSKEVPVFLNYFQEQAVTLINQGQLIYEGLPPEALNTIHSTISTAINGVNGLLKQALGFLLGFASALPKLVIITVVIIISILLISLSLPRLKEQFLSFFSPPAQEKVTIILKDLNMAMVGFVRAQIILSFLTYLITLFGLLILEIRYALSIALFIVIVDILPILGTGAVIVPWMGLHLYQGDTGTAIGLGVLYLVIIVFRRAAEPKILGDHIGISALATIVSMYLGFELFGVAGLFVGPILVIIFQAVRRAGLLEKKIDF